ncbi:Uncharacterised protein [Shigella sonnei]|nr:Uncharacterised protein [Shigella sonnei]CSR61779.1 Uncharacterised protein [Shigella sonnei]
MRGAPITQKKTIAPVIVSPCLVICQMPCMTLASIRIPNSQICNSGSPQANGISNSMVKAIAARRVSDQSRPSRIFA